MKKIYMTNTLSGVKELFTPIDSNNVRMFVCGPTVYGPMHIGHAKAYISYDFMARVIKTLYPNFTYIQNITDVDNKIIKRALDESKSVKEISEYWESQYHKNMKLLGNDQVNNYYRAHNHINEIIEQINILLEKDFAYIIEGDGVYINSEEIKKYEGFNNSTSENIEYSRINNMNKKNVSDFALWKFSKFEESITGWESPFGYGRPGWHIEDTAISEKYFGSNYDIHGGAIDLIFPHHEAEIMITKAAYNSKLANYWAHSGLLTVNGVKMGKSLNNFITVDEVLDERSGNVIRFFVLSKNYASNVDWSDEALLQAKNSIERIENYYRSASETLTNDGELYEEILDKLYDDFNTSEALAIIFKAISNKNISQNTLNKVNELFNSFIFEVEEAPDGVVKLADERLDFRKAKDWAASDRLRDEISELGWTVRDEPDGYTLVKNN